MVTVCNLGTMEYETALKIQQKAQEKRLAGEIGDIFLLVEHNRVLTMGTRAKESNILYSKEFLQEQGISVFETNRGGDVTYHGPGQIVGYPILDLKEYGRDIHLFVENIEQVIINLLAEEYGIKAQIDPKYTGVFVGKDKICAIGFSVKRWVTMHGFAFNVNTNLADFQLINPCGILDRGVTSIEKLTGEKQNFETVQKKLIAQFGRVFEKELQTITKDELTAQLFPNGLEEN